MYKVFQSIKRASDISSSAPLPLRAAYVPILISEGEHEQRPSGNGDREAIVVGAGLCDGKASVHAPNFPHIEKGKYLTFCETFTKSKISVLNEMF